MFRSVLILIIVRYGVMMISFLAIACIIYAFAGIFTKNKLLKWIITICIAVAIIFIHYRIKNPRVVQLKENVLYILPKSKAPVNPNDIYDGSKNDPNIEKHDTTKK